MVAAMQTRPHKLYCDPRSGIYCVRIQVHKVSRRFTFGKNRKTAEAALRQLERDVVAGRVSILPPAAEASTAPLQPIPPVQALPLSLLVDRHLEWVRNNRSPSTFEVRRHFLNQFRRYVGDILVVEINRLMLENFYTWARKQRGAGPNAGNAHLRHVKTMFLWAEEMGLCDCPVKKFPADHRDAARHPSVYG